MASITIRNLDDDVRIRLRVRAAEHDRSMEEEGRSILREAVSDGRAGPRNLAEVARACCPPLGGVELELPPARPDARPSEILLRRADVCH